MARKAEKVRRRAPARSGGTMMNMRAGFRGAMTGRKRPGGKREVTFLTVLLWSFSAIVAFWLFWRLSR